MFFFVLMRNIATLILIIALFASCRKEKASWDSDWRVPLIHDSLTLSKLVTDSILDINTDGSYQLVINRDLLNLNIDSLLQLPDTVIRQNVAIAVSEVNVPPGFSFLNETEDHTFEVADLILKKVVLASGMADIEISSPINAPTILTLTLPSVKKDGIVYSKTINAPPGSLSSPSTTREVLDLSGYEIDLTGQDGSSFNIIQSQVSVSSDPNGDPVTVTSQDTVRFNVEFKKLTPSYARGYFGNQSFSDTTTFDFDLMNSIVAGAIDLDNISLNIRVENGLKTSARAKFTQVQNDGVSGSSVGLSHPELGPWIWLNQATGDWNSLVPSVHNIQFDQSNSTIEAFLENIPKFMRVGYAFELNPWGNTSGGYDEFFSHSTVRAFLTANMPLAIGMNNLTYADTFALNYDNSQGTISVKSGTIEIEASNSYSFDADLHLEFLDATNTVLFQKSGDQKIKGSTSLANSAPDVEKSKIQITLSEEETSKLKDLENLVVKAVFDTPQSGSISTFYNGQFIAFKLFTNLKLTVKF